MLEYEKKFLLKRDEFVCLKCNPYCRGKTVRQVNFYFDTDEFDYDHKGITCRIREKNGKYEATVKNHRTGDGDCSEEKTCDAENEKDAALFEDMGVSFQGTLITDRVTAAPVDGVKIMLDHSTYLETEDFELEIEYDPHRECEALEILSILARHLNISPKDLEARQFCEGVCVPANKSHRFFSHLRELKEIRR